MLYLKQFVFAVIIAMMCLLTVGGALAQDDTEAARHGLRPDAPSYAVRGSHPVGTRDFVIDSETPLDITVWYPALNEMGIPEAITYPYAMKWDAPPDADITVTGQAISDAPYDLSMGAYPLVVLSPGFSMGRTTYAWLAEHLASYGFVVVAPEHHEQFDPMMSDFWKSTITRPQDIQTVLDYIATQTTAGRAFEGLINTESVAVVGHSYGGYTALTAAGAQYDIDGFGARCETAYAEADPSAWLCDLIIPHMPDMATLAGFDAVPDGLWSPWTQLPVDAIVSMAGDAYIFDQAGLAEITIPVMAIGGTGDTGTPYLWGTYPTYEYVSSVTKARVAFEGAEHMIFATACDTIPWFRDNGYYGFCSDPVWDMDRAHDLVNHFTTAFLLSQLNNDTEAAAALVPDGVLFPGITYEAQGF